MHTFFKTFHKITLLFIASAISVANSDLPHHFIWSRTISPAFSYIPFQTYMLSPDVQRPTFSAICRKLSPLYSITTLRTSTSKYYHYSQNRYTEIKDGTLVRNCFLTYAHETHQCSIVRCYGNMKLHNPTLTNIFYICRRKYILTKYDNNLIHKYLLHRKSTPNTLIKPPNASADVFMEFTQECQRHIFLHAPCGRVA
jgi:hypothetical protein